jgi:hypothetical protein
VLINPIIRTRTHFIRHAYHPTRNIILGWIVSLSSTQIVNIQDTCSSEICLFGFIALVDLGRFFSFLIYTQSIGLLGRGISPSQGRYLHTEQHNLGINADKHPCLEWDSVFERAKTVHAFDSAANVIRCSSELFRFNCKIGFTSIREYCLS